MKKRTYNVMLLSSSSTFHAVIKSLLAPSNYPSICSAYSVQIAKEFLQKQHFDLVLVDTPLSDAPGNYLLWKQAKKKVRSFYFL